MSSFTDSLNRVWSLRITVSTIRRVRDNLGIDLANILADPEILEKLGRDIVLLVDTLAAVCQPQMQEKGISDEQFAEGLCGDALDHATQALLNGIAGFFPEKKRKMLQTLLEKSQLIEEAGMEEVMNSIELLPTSGKLFTPLQDFQDSTQIGSHSES